MPVTDRSASEGVSLARGPALILGTVLLVAGLYFLYKLPIYPKLHQFPNGHATTPGKAFFGVFGVNGWSGELTAAGGGLLLIGAAQHALAKVASLIVAVVLGGVAVWALFGHHSALGIFAANIWTIILWGGSAAYLLINALLPRVGTATDTTPSTVGTGAASASPPAARQRRPAAPRPVENKTDNSTVIAERDPIRVRPSDPSAVGEDTTPDSTAKNEGRP